MIHTVRWTAQKIAQRLKLIEPLVYRRRQPLSSFRHRPLAGPLDPQMATPDFDDSAWPIIPPNTYWGTWWTDFVLRAQFQVPEDWAADAPIALYLPLGESGDFSHPEALAYIDGVSIAACDRHHQEIRLPDAVRDGQAHTLALHGWTGIGGLAGGEPGSKLFMRQCEVVQIDSMLREFVITVRNVLGVIEKLTDDHPAKGHLLNGLNDAFNVLDTREPIGGEEFYESVVLAQMELQDGTRQAGEPLDVNIVATGHAHLDVTWLWLLQHTRQKARRTFHTVLHLMDQFPEYHFTQSQPQLYDFVRQDDPGLFERIQRQVEEGRWEPIGGMWVEADCNLSGAESLARQFVLGRSFFRAHFGADAESPVVWLPDVFGYAWALPQLIKQAGLDYFFTIKMGWSQYNRFPYDSFWWQGLDGTRVLTHFSTTPEPGSPHASTYTAMASAQDAIGTWTNFQQKELQHELLMAYGFGDGGGPTREMIENIRELHAMPGAPRLRQGSVIEFFRQLETEAGDRLPVWNGELYLELHRGTYTTQSRNKRANRKAEFALHDAEFLAAYAAQLDAAYPYPIDQLRAAWQLVCLNQFHDIIPGSSIGPVYVESLQQYAEVQLVALRARDEALDVIDRHTDGDVLIVNPTSFARNDLAFLPNRLPPDQTLHRSDGQPVLTQSTPDGTLIDAGKLAPYSVLPLVRKAAGRVAGTGDEGSSLQATASLLENNYLRVEFNDDGDIIRIYDKVNQREVLPPGAIANQLQAFEDRPLAWDAWDIDIFYDDRQWLSDPAISIEVVETGPLRAAIEIRRRILHSDYLQHISLMHNRPRLDFDTAFLWQEKHVLLKVAFPVDVLSPVATYEIQWGNVQRPTHRNTSWDYARFETCAHKWIDLSEGGYGVSLLNDCKYGHDVRDNVMRLSLLRSPTMPDPNADEGTQRFAYSLLPHSGDWDERTVREAYALNDPLIARLKPEGGGVKGNVVLPPSREAFILCNAPNVVIETIKQAEDGNGIIARLYESQRRRGTITLTTAFNLAGAWRCNLLEQNQAEVAVEENWARLFVKPYEIVTLRLIPAAH